MPSFAATYNKMMLMRAATVVQVLQDLVYVLLHVLLYLWSLRKVEASVPMLGQHSPTRQWNSVHNVWRIATMYRLLSISDATKIRTFDVSEVLSTFEGVRNLQAYRRQSINAINRNVHSRCEPGKIHSRRISSLFAMCRYLSIFGILLLTST